MSTGLPVCLLSVVCLGVYMSACNVHALTQLAADPGSGHILDLGNLGPAPGYGLSLQSRLQAPWSLARPHCSGVPRFLSPEQASRLPVCQSASLPVYLLPTSERLSLMPYPWLSLSGPVCPDLALCHRRRLHPSSRARPRRHHGDRSCSLGLPRGHEDRRLGCCCFHAKYGLGLRFQFRF